MAIDDKKVCMRAYEAFDPNITLGGVKITHIPEKPENFRTILNFGKKPENRTFPYEDFPEIVVDRDSSGNIIDTSFSGMTEEEEIKYLQKLRSYWFKGIWFYNGDKLEYITGDHWYYLNIMKLNVKYIDNNGVLQRGRKNPYFIDGDRDWYLMWKQCEVMTFVAGMIYVTKRRAGKSMKACSVLLSAATRTKEAECGIQAQNGEFAKKMFSELVNLWKKIPKHELFFPTHIGNDNPTAALEFTAPTKVRGSSKFFAEKETLNSLIDWQSTTSAAYDGRTMYRFLIDEASKIRNCDINELVGIVKETLGDGASYIGKMIITSTAENLGGQTLKQFENLWNTSNPAVRNDFDQTTSGFFRFFQGADVGYRYDPKIDGKISAKYNKPTIDHWGYSDKEAARAIILELRRGKTGDDLIKFTRKFPLSEEEAFMYAENTCPFDTIKINTQRNHNEDLRVSGQLDIVQGDFVWGTGQDFQRVEFHPSDKGKWQVAWMPEEEDRNKFEFSMNVGRPTRSFVYTGIDPFDHNMTEDGKRFSNGAGVSICLGHPTHLQRGFVCTYNNRPPTAAIFYEDMLKQAMFYSSPIIVENQKAGIITWFNGKGFGGFIEGNPLELKNVKEGVSTSGKDTRIAMINGMVAYVHEYIGKKTKKVDGDFIDTWGDCPFEELLDDLIKFNPSNWTPSDLTVAGMLALLSLRKREYTYAEPQQNLSDFISLSK